MRVVYLLNGGALYGGVKVVYQQVRALRRLGVEAEVVSPDPPSDWFPEIETFYRQGDPQDPRWIGPADVAVGTIWFTVPWALEVEGAVPFHLCQCYEALYSGVREQWEEIDAVYRLPTRKLAISPHLVDLLEERFEQPVTWIPQAFEPDVFHPPAEEKGAEVDAPLRVLLGGQYGLDIKGVDWGMAALRPLFEAEAWPHLVRLAIDAPAEEVALWPEAERHIAIAPVEVPEVMRSVDVYVGLSTEVEGFGLPALEAMGCGRPCVLTDIGATRALDPDDEASLKVPVGDGEALRQALRRLRDDPALRRRLGRAGRRLAEQYTEERTARALVTAFRKALPL
jgi:glycosyltransferase involved in cell wall biosynthesis